MKDFYDVQKRSVAEALTFQQEFVGFFVDLASPWDQVGENLHHHTGYGPIQGICFPTRYHQVVSGWKQSIFQPGSIKSGLKISKTQCFNVRALQVGFLVATWENLTRNTLFHFSCSCYSEWSHPLFPFFSDRPFRFQPCFACFWFKQSWIIRCAICALS